MRNVVGIINLHDGPHLGNLTENRPLGTVTLLGRYGLMDFALSNISNSGIDRIGIMVEKNVQAVRTHLGSGSIWINNTVTGFIRYFSNEKDVNNDKFNTDVRDIAANRHQLEGLDADYVLVVPPFFLMSIDFNEVIKQHIENDADITVIYTNAKKADRDYKNCEELVIGENGRVSKILDFNGMRKNADISLQTYVFKRSTFETLVRKAKEVSAFYNIRQMVTYMTNNNLVKTQAYEFDGYVAPMISLENYVRYSFELLDYKNRAKLFDDDWPIYTTTHNTPPSLYGPNADVKNSFIANGSIIKGKVRNSIISRDVIVEEGAVIENSILFSDTYVGEGVKVNYVLTDKYVRIEEKKKVAGSEDEILCIAYGVKI